MAAIVSLQLKCSYDMSYQYLKDTICFRTYVYCEVCFRTKICYKTLCETSHCTFTLITNLSTF